MGFFSNLIDLAPNRTVALEIKNYCSRTSLNAKESELLKNSKIDEQQYIWLRNSCNYCVFTCLIKVMRDKYPNTYWSITQSVLDDYAHEEFYSQWRISLFRDLNVPTPGTSGLWDDYFDDVCARIEKKLGKQIPNYIKEQLKVITNEHQLEIVGIIKASASKLNKPI